MEENKQAGKIWKRDEWLKEYYKVVLESTGSEEEAQYLMELAARGDWTETAMSPEIMAEYELM